MAVPVLLMIHSLGHGGSERQLAAIARTLDRSRFEPHVASVFGGFRADELRRSGIPLLTLPITSYLKPSILRTAAQLRRYIRTNGIRLVHTFDYSLSFMVCLNMIAIFVFLLVLSGDNFGVIYLIF